MNFSKTDGFVREMIDFDNRSAVILRDDARYKWAHEIKPVKSDVFKDGVRRQRHRRVSLTFRKTLKKK
jgi:hypothetical protein